MSAAAAGAGPLDGLRVVDLSTSVAGFQAGQVLCDFGAEVVHVEPPGGSPLRALPSYPFLARGRKSIVLDLKQAADVATAQQLAAGADVVIETLRPGVAERLGLGFDTLTATNQGLVYASITGFGRTGPYADVQGYEALVIARLGGLSVSGGMVERPGPAHVSAPWASYGATQLALTGILSALHERERSGRGQRVDTSLVQGVAGQGPYNWFLRVIADRYPDAFNVTPPFSDAGVTEVATCPNVVLKLGGIGMPMFGTTWHERDIQPGPDEVAAHWGDAVRSCIDTFGPDRCMFESNFAVDRISMTYATAWAAFDLISQTYSPAERAALFHDTAVRTYRLDRQDTA